MNKPLGLGLCLVTFAALAAPAAAQPAAPVPLRVTVRSEAGAPLRDATVHATDAAGVAHAASAGRGGVAAFRALAPGRLRLRLSHVGFAPLDTTVTVGPGEAAALTLRLSPAPLSLEEAVVAADRLTAEQNRRARVGFDERRGRGNGVFLTYEQVMQRSARGLADVLRSVAGLRVARTPAGDRLMSSRYPNCPAALFLDGVYVLDGSNFIGSVALEHVSAIEVYRDVSEIPREFRPLDRTCGAVLVWTRITVAR